MGCCSKEKKGKDLSKTKTKPIKTIKKAKKSIEQIKTTNVPKENLLQHVSKTKERAKSPIEQWIDEIPSEGNISSIKTFDELKNSIEQNPKSISLVLFYGHFCPFSKRTVPGLRQWAKTNRDRIHLYEVDVEQRTDLTNFYHVRTIPTVMAFSETNLFAPVWQRTANQVLPVDLPEQIEPIKPEEKTIEEVFRTKFDRSMNFSLNIDPMATEVEEIFKFDQTKSFDDDERVLVVLKDPKSPSKFVVAILNEKKTIEDSSRPEPMWSYRWATESNSPSDQSSRKFVKDEKDYDGRLSSNSTSTTKEEKQSFVPEEFLSTDEYRQNVHLSDRNELFYEKQFDEIRRSFSNDRFSTLTTQNVKNATQSIDNQEDICVLFLGPHGVRGFEENRRDDEQIPSKLSLLTLKSNSFDDD